MKTQRDIAIWDMIKDMVYPCLAPRGWKKPKSGQAVCKRFLDLVIYYIVRMEVEGSMMSFCVPKPLKDKWGIDMDTLDTQARENAQKDGYTIRRIREFIGIDALDMYVMKNRRGLYGTAGMLDKSMLAQFADERGTDIYILPASVHELVLLPATAEWDKKDLDGTIKDANRLVVDPRDRLADHAYIYERSGGIRIL